MMLGSTRTAAGKSRQGGLDVSASFCAARLAQDDRNSHRCIGDKAR
jgi:hypothetical protein